MKLVFAVLSFLVLAVDFGQLEQAGNHRVTNISEEINPKIGDWKTFRLDPFGSEVAHVYSAVRDEIIGQLVPKYDNFTLYPGDVAIRAERFDLQSGRKITTFYDFLVFALVNKNGKKTHFYYEALVLKGYLNGKPVYALQKLLPFNNRPPLQKMIFDQDNWNPPQAEIV